ncbi:MAG: DNA polymerase III subunit gamma/tau C-terminal domain-containing protein, partial [Burkholderiales bacterium]
LLDQAIAHGGGKVGEGQVRDMLGSVESTHLIDILNALVERNGPGVLAKARQIFERGLSFDAAAQELGLLLHQVALAQIVPQALGDEQDEAIVDLAQRLSPEEVQLYYQIVAHGRRDLGLAPDEFAGFTMMLMRLLAFAPEGEGIAVPACAGALTTTLAVQPAAGRGISVPGFDSDWPGLVARLQLGGMARMLAQHCELTGHGEGGLELSVPEEHKHLLDKSYQDKLKAALNEYFGKPYRISIKAGQTNGMSPVALDEREKRAKQAAAIEAVESDPFVRELVENFDAQVIESTIKPVQ